MALENELVVARFNEDVSWVLDSPYPVSLYNHGSSLNLDHSNVDIINLPNLGRESGCWFEHICANYNDLADWTYFVQAEPHQSIDELWKRLAIEYADTTPLTSRYLPEFPKPEVKALDRVEWISGVEVHWGLADHFGSRLPSKNQAWLEQVWRQYFTVAKPDPWWYGYCCMYAVPKRRILDRPLAFWSWLRVEVNRHVGTRTDAELTTTSPWAIEAVAYYLFGDSTLYPVRLPVPLEPKKLPKATESRPQTKGCGCGSDRPRINQ